MVTKNDFLERLARTPVVFDGAMGTMIYQRGVFINACYDELCLTRPELILTIHQEYVEAGADVIESNTFGANRMKLAAFGLADKVEAINRGGVRLARQAAGDEVYVAASVGPCLDADKPYEPNQAAEIAQAFRQQLAVIAEEGADLVVLETFDKLAELQVAANQAAQLGLTVVASFVMITRLA